ncbi:MAG: hypothetical protein AAFN30_09090 [Actinomycetota bacterium]
MNETYIGWDGKQYPWPPPEGWHEAIDGRWWAPGTGPNPPPQGAGTQAAPGSEAAPGAGAGAGPAAAAAGGGVAAGPEHSQTSQMPAFQPGQTVAAGQGDPTAAFGSPTMQQPAGGGPAATPATVNYGLQGGPDVSPMANPDFEPAKQGGGILQAALIVFGMVAVALIGGLGYFYFTSDRGDDTATGDSTETTDTTADANTDNDGTDPAAADPDDDPDTTDTTSPDDGSSTDDNGDPDSDSDDPDNDGVEDDTTSTITGSNAQLDQFRMILNDNGLTSNNLADDAINSFADSFCGMAREAEDADAFDATRESSVASTQSGLEDDELRLVINAAIISFCPEEAERLGVEL